MAEVRGQYKYHDNGTVAQLVSGETVITDAPMLPMEKQAQLKRQIESNTTPLGISATYTGASFDTMADGENFTWLTGYVFSNVAGTLYIEQSADGQNWYGLNTINVAANGAMPIDVKVLLKHVRLKYVNGATAQTTFQLYGYVTFL
jgi:hypothetical protein